MTGSPDSETDLPHTPEELPTLAADGYGVSDKPAGRVSTFGGEIPGWTIGPYTLVEKLGEGGFGTVWRAKQSEPVKREVALKVIKPGRDTEEVIKRFEQERQALAVMDHPNIARVFDAGATDSGRPYFVMEIVEGEPVTLYCEGNRLTIRERLELFIPVCRAVQHAHAKGIVHRDLKPSNVLVAEHDGKPSPKVIDFGIAKAMEENAREDSFKTMEGIAIGTPIYMSPEQVSGGTDVDTRSDIYSLGAMLYELLTGITPIDPKELKQAGYAEMERLICEVEPIWPSDRTRGRNADTTRLSKQIRGELDWIVMRALEKDRERRYETANSLALELQRFLNNEPVLAGPPSVSYRLGKFIRRQKGPLSAAAALFIVLIAGVVSSLWQAKVARASEGIAQEKRAEAEIATAEAVALAETIRRNLYIAEMNLAAEESARPRGVERVAALTEKWRPQERSPDLRGWEWYYLESLLRQDSATLRGHTGGVLKVAYSPDGKVVASGGEDKTIRLWEVQTRKELHVLRGHPNTISALAWSPDAKRLASGSRDGTVRIWNPADGSTSLIIKDLTIKEVHSVGSLSWSHDGAALAVGVDGSDSARTWRADTGEEIRSYSGSQDTETAKGVRLVWRPQHEQLAIVQVGAAPSIVEAGSGIEVMQIGGPLMKEFEWHPQGVFFAQAGSGGGIPIWDMRSRKIIYTLAGHSVSGILSISWSQGGNHIASAATDATIRVWNFKNGGLLGTLLGHFDRCESVSWRPDGMELASGSSDGTVKLWNTRALIDSENWQQETRYVHSIAWSPDGSRVAVAASLPKAGIYIWDYESRERVLELLVPTSNDAPAFAWSPDGLKIAALDWDGSLWIWDAQTGDVVDRRDRPTDFNRSRVPPRIAWHPGGKILAYGGRSESLIVYQTVERKEVAQLPGSNLGSLEWAPDGSGLAFRGPGGFQIWDPLTMKPFAPVSQHPLRFQWNSDGRYLLAAFPEGHSKILRTCDWSEVTELKGTWLCAVWSPDDHRIATAVDNLIRIWDPKTGEQLAALHGHQDQVLSLAWSPDGRNLLSGGKDRMFLWDAGKAYEAEEQR